MKKLKLSQWLFCGLIMFLLFFANDVYSQTICRQSISSYGTSQSTENNVYSQTAGQAYSTQSTGDYSVTQGFQQPAKFRIEKLVQNRLPELEIDLYPNPAQYSVILNSKEELDAALVRVTNLQGNIIYLKELSNLSMHQINCSSWAAGIYLIKVTDSDNKQTVRKLTITK